MVVAPSGVVTARPGVSGGHGINFTFAHEIADPEPQRFCNLLDVDQGYVPGPPVDVCDAGAMQFRPAGRLLL